MDGPVWVIDTSALIQIKSFVPHELRAAVYVALSALVMLGIPSVPLLGLLRAEGITYRA